jgi:hypothetical protein
LRHHRLTDQGRDVSWIDRFAQHNSAKTAGGFDQIGAGIDAVTLRITAGGKGIGVDDQRLASKPARRWAAPRVKTSANRATIRATGPFKATPTFIATAIWAT